MFLFSQKEYNQWVVGYKYFIDFNTPDGSPILSDLHTLVPSPLNTFASNSYTRRPSLFCNSDGSLKLFSIGNYLFNSSDEFIETPDNIMGGKRIPQSMTDNNGNVFNYWFLNCEIQNSMFVKVGRKSIRLVNHNKSNDYSKTLPNIISYDVFDDDTLIIKDQIVNENYNSESLYAVKNFTNDNYWLIGYDDRSQNYICYEVDSNGVKNNIHSMYNSELIDETVTFCYSRIIKSSPNGQYLLLSVACYDENIKHEKSKADSYYELLEFNPLTGEFLKKIDTFYLGCSVEMEFSMNSRYIYFMTNESFHPSSGTGNSFIFQYDLYKEKSNGPILSNTAYYSTMQLAPNGKIYFSRNSSLTFSNNKIISNQINPLLEMNNPELPAEKISIKSLRFKGDTLRYLWSLPNIPTSQYLRIYTKSKFEICESEDVQLESFVVYPQADTVYSWSGPNGFTSDEQNPLLNNLTKADEGIYLVTVSGGDESYTAETYVKINELPEPKLRAYPKAFICDYGDISISVTEVFDSYKWTTGDTTDFITVTKAGTYGVTVTNGNGCEAYTELEVGFRAGQVIAIEGDTVKCVGESVTLTSTDNYPEYRWSNGENTKSITVTNPAKYTLTVKTDEGCTVSRTIEVKDYLKVNIDFKPTPTTICKGDSILIESKFTPSYYSYKWNTGATTRGIYVNSTGVYKLKIIDTRTGCNDSTEIAINVEDNLQPKITGSNICSGESAILTALPNDPSYTYLWSNGEETPVIEVSVAGTYSVTVSKAGCVGTAEFTVNETPTPEFEILGESIICNNETATLSSSKDFAEYLWSNNEVTKEIEVTEAGTYTLTITDENGCTATESFTVNKYELNFDISKGSIDFVKVYITETKSDNTTIINNSGFDITLANGQIIADGQSYPYDYNFVPTQLGAFNNSIDISIIEPCDTIISIPITARVYARATISTDDIYTQIGQTETVPVYLECEADLPAQEYTITTDIDRTAFFTDDSYTINQNQPINKAKTNIHNLTGTILLSESLEYDITFTDVSFTNPYIEVIEEPGKIYIDSVCAFDFRNITTFDETTLETNPNPATDGLNVTITTGVQGTMKIELVSTDGRVIYTTEWQQSTKTKQMLINTIDIPSGLYQLRLITPYDAITKSVMVVE